MLGFKGNGKYKPGQVGPVLSGWDKLEMNILRQRINEKKTKKFTKEKN